MSCREPLTAAPFALPAGAAAAVLPASTRSVGPATDGGRIKRVGPDRMKRSRHGLSLNDRAGR